jgi:hypothetical protein
MMDNANLDRPRPLRMQSGQGVPVVGPIDPDIRLMAFYTSSPVEFSAFAISDTLQPRLRMSTIRTSRRCELSPSTNVATSATTRIATITMAMTPQRKSMLVVRTGGDRRLENGPSPPTRPKFIDSSNSTASSTETAAKLARQHAA